MLVHNAGRTSLPGARQIRPPRHQQADNDEYLLFGIRAVEKSWFDSRFKLSEHREP